MKPLKTKIKLDLQIASQATNLPTKALFTQWTAVAIGQDAALCIRIVDSEESAELNGQYRQKPYATNVLSFPFEAPEGLSLAKGYLGDIVICAEVVAQEAQDQQKPLFAHWAHMTVHGVLHLQGYDHVAEQEALVMESLETQILTQLGFANPYGD